MNRPRALLRLLLAACVLLAIWIRVELPARLRGACIERDTRRAQRGTRRLNRALGIELHVTGRIPDGRAVLVANHRSYMDIPAILACVECTFLAKVEMGRWPLFGAIARRLHTVFVDRDSKESRRASRRDLAALIDRGRRVALFPEGTTTTGPGCMPFQPGMFFTAAERRVPVVPVALHYEHAEDSWVGDDTLLRHFFERFARPRMRVHVAFGPELVHADGAALRRGAEVWIAEAIERAALVSRRGTAAHEEGMHGDRFVPGGVPLPAGQGAPGR